MTEAVATQPAVKFVSSLDHFERVFSYPLVKLAQLLLDRMQARIARGQGAQQPMRPLGADAEDVDNRERRFFAPPSRPQPEGDGFLTRHKTGPKAGWALYRSYKAYALLVGHGAPRDIEETGAFRRAVAIRVMSAARVKIAPYGSHVGPSGEKISNTAVGYLASRREPLPLLHPSAQEVREAATLLFQDIDGQAIEAAATVGLVAPVRRAATSAQKRVAKLARRR